MQKVALKSLALGLSLLAANAFADVVIYDNGAPRTDSGRCISNGGGCGTGFSIYDTFTIGSSTVLTGFENWNAGSNAADYTNTKWSIWTTDPSRGGKPLASGTAVASVSLDAGFIATTVSGLSVSLKAGTYWLGIGQTISGSTPWTYANSKENTGHDAIGIDAAGTNVFFVQEDPALRIYGSVATVPESTTSQLMLTGFAALGALVARRKKSAS